MSTERGFDVVLFGYRNDVAESRVLEHLGREPLVAAARVAALPHRVASDLPSEAAAGLATRLEALGAYVAVTDAGSPLGRLGADQRPAPASSTVPWLVLGVVLLAAVVVWRYGGPGRAALDVDRLVGAPDLVSMSAAVVDDEGAARLNADGVRLAGAGRYGDAVARLEDAARAVPGHPVVSRNLQVVLFNWGVTELAAGHLDTAVARLEESAALGEHRDVLRVLGIARARRGDLTLAATALERALALGPTDTSVLLALGDVYLKEARRPQALDLFARAREAGVRDPKLDELIRRLSREVDAEWDFVALDTPHFRVSFADSEDRGTVEQVRRALEDAYRTVGRKFEHYPDAVTEVVLYTKQGFHVVTDTPDWAGAAFDGRIKLPVGGLQPDDPNLARVVRHEYAHSLVARLAGAQCPAWLNEGLAVWAEEEQEGERLAWAEERLADHAPFAFEQLDGSFTGIGADRITVAYAQSYLAVRMLVDRFGARKLPALLAALGRTHRIDDAYAEVYPGDFARFQDEFFQRVSG